MSLKTNITILTLLFLTTSTNPSTQSPPPSPQPQFNRQTFQSDNNNISKFLACWLYIREYETHKNKKFSENQWLLIVKNCMNKISQKNTVLKITSLGKKNIEPVVPLSTFLKLEKQLTKLDPFYLQNQYDIYLLNRSHSFENQLDQLEQKGSIQKQIDQYIKKRQIENVSYFSWMNKLSHSTILIISTCIILCCFTFFQCYKMEQYRKKQRYQEIQQPNNSQRNNNRESKYRNKIKK